MGIDFISTCTTRFGSLAIPYRPQVLFIKGLSAPEKQLDPLLDFTIPDDRIAIDKPNRLPCRILLLASGKFLLI